MSRQKTLPLGIAVVLVILFLVGCGGPAATPVSEAPAAAESPPITPTPEPPTATPTTEPPTATPTPIPPTATPTPSCDLECVGSKGPSLEIGITCETGEFSSTTRSWDEQIDGKWVTMVVSESDEISETVKIWYEQDKERWVTKFEGTRIYKNSGNEYKIAATTYDIENAQGNWENKYSAEVTGGVFGETPKICENE